MKSELDTALDAVIAGITAPGGPLAVGTANVRGVELPAFAAAVAVIPLLVPGFIIDDGADIAALVAAAIALLLLLRVLLRVLLRMLLRIRGLVRLW